MITQYKWQQQAYDNFLEQCDHVKDYNKYIIDPSFWHNFWGIEIGDKLPYPGYPMPDWYSGYTLDMLWFRGGYGIVSGGMYNTKIKGYKPFGAVGQTPEKNQNVVLIHDEC